MSTLVFVSLFGFLLSRDKNEVEFEEFQYRHLKCFNQ